MYICLCDRCKTQTSPGETCCVSVRQQRVAELCPSCMAECSDLLTRFVGSFPPDAPAEPAAAAPSNVIDFPVSAAPVLTPAVAAELRKTVERIAQDPGFQSAIKGVAELFGMPNL